MDPSLTTVLATSLEKAINTALRYDPATRTGIESLSGKVVQIICEQPQLTLFFRFKPDSEREDSGNILNIMAYYEVNADTTISGSAKNLGLLLLSPGHSTASSGVQIRGDLATLSQLQAILQNVDLDWEQIVQEVTGSGITNTILPHQIATIVRQAVSSLKNIGDSVQRNMAGYLSEELRATPSQNELENFYVNVDSLRADVDRLAARVDTFIDSIKKET